MGSPPGRGVGQRSVGDAERAVREGRGAGCLGAPPVGARKRWPRGASTWTVDVPSMVSRIVGPAGTRAMAASPRAGRRHRLRLGGQGRQRVRRGDGRRAGRCGPVRERAVRPVPGAGIGLVIGNDIGLGLWSMISRLPSSSALVLLCPCAASALRRPRRNCPKGRQRDGRWTRGQGPDFRARGCGGVLGRTRLSRHGCRPARRGRRGAPRCPGARRPAGVRRAGRAPRGFVRRAAPRPCRTG